MAPRGAGSPDAIDPRIYTLQVGDEVKVEVVQDDGARALVVGRLDGVPHSIWGGRALKLRLTQARACALPPKQ